MDDTFLKGEQHRGDQEGSTGKLLAWAFLVQST